MFDPFAMASALQVNPNFRVRPSHIWIKDYGAHITVTEWVAAVQVGKAHNLDGNLNNQSPPILQSCVLGLAGLVSASLCSWAACLMNCYSRDMIVSVEYI